MARTFYVQIQPGEITIQCFKTGKEVSEPAVIEIKEKRRKLHAIRYGKDAANRGKNTDTLIVWPFKHPRSLITDPITGALLLLKLLGHFYNFRFYKILPYNVIIHPLQKIENGLTIPEKLAFTEMGEHAGALKCYVYTGKILSLEDVNTDMLKVFDVKKFMKYQDL